VFVTKTVPFLQPQFFAREETIYVEGEHADEIYFIRKGRVGYVLDESNYFKMMPSGSYFGDLEVIM
jgi:CRP-like cAMP-binding protein